MAFSVNGAGETEYSIGKTEKNLNLPWYTKTNSKCIINLNAKPLKFLNK